MSTQTLKGYCISNKLCCVCVTGNRKMISVEDIDRQSFYEITNFKTLTGPRLPYPEMVCCVCHREVEKIREFGEMTIRASGVLRDLYQRGFVDNSNDQSERLGTLHGRIHYFKDSFSLSYEYNDENLSARLINQG